MERLIFGVGAINSEAGRTRDGGRTSEKGEL